MPIYTYQCQSCDKSIDLLRDVEDRKKTVPCQCGPNTEKVRRPEVFRAEVFEAYYDEGLGSDVYSSADRKAIMRELDVIEAGDKVHGGRHFDEKAEEKIDKQAPKGISRRGVKDETKQVVQVVDCSGEISASEDFRDLPNAGESKSAGQDSFEKAWSEAKTER